MIEPNATAINDALTDLTTDAFAVKGLLHCLDDWCHNNACSPLPIHASEHLEGIRMALVVMHQKVTDGIQAIEIAAHTLARATDPNP